MSIYSEIKKYLLILVGFFCLILAGHIVILYLYNDAETYAIQGGTINIGIVGKKPTLDILSVDTKIDNNNNDTVLRFLYRGLLRYSPSEKKIVSDLARCGLDTFPTIRCTLNGDALWSDGTSLTLEDITSSYEFFRENARNETTKSKLALVEPQEDRGDIVFRFRTNDATTMDILFLPILSKKDIAKFELDASIAGNLSSGPYIFDSVEEKKGNFLLKQNPYFRNPAMVQYFDQIRFGFGETEEELARVIDADMTLSDIPLDLAGASNYLRPLVYGIFMNTSRVPNTLRGAIFNDVFFTQSLSIDETMKKQESIFLGEIPTETKKTVEGLFIKSANALGYYMGGKVPENTIPQAPISPEKPTKYVTRPGKVTPLFIGTETIEIGGTAPRGTTKVIINDYTLQNYSASKRQFIYNAKKEFKNLVDGANIYKISFYGGSKLIDSESMTIYYNTKADELTKLKNDWLAGVTPPTPTATVPQVKAENLDPNKLYNREGKPLIFQIIVQDDIPLLKTASEHIAQKLESLGAGVEVTLLPLTDIKKNIPNPDFSYDIVLTGINLGLFHYNILPFFHSGQVKEGFNISKIRNATLDSIMERMTEDLYYSAPDKLRNYETNAQKILAQESVFFPLASPYEFAYTKNTVLGLTVPEFLTGRELLIDIVSGSYFKQGYKRSDESKTLLGFFVWLKNELFSHI